jgi:hypothetical protein
MKVRGEPLPNSTSDSRTASMMAYIFSLSPLAKALLVGWVVVTALLVFLLLQNTSEVATAHIVIRLSDDLQKLNLHFGLLHVRDGKDELKDSGPLLNEEIEFRAVDRRGTLEAVVKFSKRLGFQFKCFVDQGEYGYDRIETLLKDNKFVEISKGEGKRNRIWFILPDQSTYKTFDEFINNYYYPA